MDQELLPFFYKKVLLLLAFLLGIVFQEGYAQTTLSAGDVAIVTANADDDKNFDFMPLVDLDAGTEIYFTDIPYIKSASSLDVESGEGVLKYTAEAEVDGGAIISYNGTDGSEFEQVSGDFSPSVSGDNIISYQADVDTTFLYGIGWARGSSWEYNGGSNASDIPPGLSKTANTILNLGTTHNYQYNEANGKEGTANSLLSLVGDEKNWNKDENNAFPSLNVDFTLVDPPTIAFSATQISTEEGSTVDLEVELVEANEQAVDIEVAFLSEASTATNGEDFISYSTQTISFSDQDQSGATQTITIELIDDSDFENSEKAVFRLQNISTGTIISPRTHTLTIEDNDASDIVINEIHADPDPDHGDANNDGSVDTSEDKFVEFINNSDQDIDISGWKYFDNSSQSERYTFPEGTVIPAGTAFVIFGAAAENTSFGGAALFSAGSVGLNDQGEKIWLEDDQGNTIVSVDYPDAGNGQSIVRDPEIKGDFVDHSSVSESDALYSPGTKVNGTAFGSKYAVGLRGSAGWRMVATPTKETAFQELFGNLWVQGISGSDDPSGDLTLAGWNESQASFADLPTNMSEEVIPGKGYIVYVFGDNEFSSPGIQGGAPKVIDTNGDENNSTIDMTVSASDSDENGEINGNEGWNLLGNPFGTDISVSALISELETVQESVNANIYIWDHDKGDGNGGYVSLSVGDRIAPFQGFFVRFTEPFEATNFQFEKSTLEASTGTEFYKKNTEDSFSFDLYLHTEQFYDTFTLTFQEDGRAELDRHDGYKLFSLNANSINLYSTIEGNRLQANTLPNDLESSLEIPISFDSNGRSDLVFKWGGFEDIPSDWDIRLIDKEINREVDLRTSQEYRFSVLSDQKEKSQQNEQLLLNKRNGNNSESRFVLSVNPNFEAFNENEIPETVQLKPNYPNPFNPNTTIPFELTQDSEVKLTVWNMIGQKVATLVDGMVEAGTHEEAWNASSMPSGIYIARFEVNGNVFTRKMTLIK